MRLANLATKTFVLRACGLRPETAQVFIDEERQAFVVALGPNQSIQPGKTHRGFPIIALEQEQVA